MTTFVFDMSGVSDIPAKWWQSGVGSSRVDCSICYLAFKPFGSHLYNVQILEHSSFGLRSAYRVMVNDLGAPQIHLFPMVHLAQQSFYDDVKSKLQKCETICVEGVRSRKVLRLTSSYRFAVKNPKLNLVLQSKIKSSDMSGDIINIDVDPCEFDRKWAARSFRLKVEAFFLSPLFGFYMRFFGTREKIAKAMNMDVLKSREDILWSTPQSDEMNDMILHWRDLELLKKLDNELSVSLNKKNDIAIVFGAGHMRAIIRHLCDVRGYRVGASEWMTVFDL